MMKAQSEARAGGAAEETGGRLEGVRASIDEVDRSLVALIGVRCSLARSAGDAKRAERRPLVDPGQEAAVVRRVAEQARERGIDEESVRQIFWNLIELARRAQEDAGRLEADGGHP
jgi:chorismate mutase